MRYKITSQADPQTYLDQDTFCPMKKFNIDLSILMAAQHDGRLWTERDVRMNEYELIEGIMEKLRKIVTQAVLDTEPFSIHAHY